MRLINVVGIDLAGSERRPTGFCVLSSDLFARTKIVYTDSEIVANVASVKPRVIAIDAPLAIPLGRRSLEERSDIHLRLCDRELLELGIKFFPITLGPMRKLTVRGIALKKILEAKGFKVVETFPGGAQDLLGLPRKREGTEKLRRALTKLGVKGDTKRRTLTGDELDAITCALVAKMYVEGDYIALGDPREVLMILPTPKF